MAEQDPNIQGSGVNEPVPYVTADVAWEMSKRAAAEARAEALKEAQVQLQNNGNQIQNSGNQVQNSGNARDNRYIQDNRDIQNDRRPQDNRDYRRDRDDDYDDRGSRRRRRRDDDDEEEDLVGFSPKLIKQLQTTVGVFNTLKDFSSNPMQKAIEDRIGGLAAGIIENAFTSPRGPPPKRDIVDTILNSQMAFGLGQGLGSRAPELVETLSKSFGKEKAEGMIEGMIGKYGGGGGGGGQRRIESGDRDKAEPAEPSHPSPTPPKSDDQSNIELLLSLDPNNPEHVAAYAESQGGISIDVARKMLMIHQDDIIKRMKSQGADTTIIESQRGSRIGQDNPSQRSTMDQDITPISEQRQNSQMHRVDVASDYQTPPAQQVPYVPQPPPADRTAPVAQVPPVYQPSPVQNEPPTPVPHENGIQEDMQYVEPGLESISSISEDHQNKEQEYAEYKDMGKDKPLERNVDQTLSNNQQTEMMKAFADDIGKVMGDMIGKIEGLNNTVFSLQSELNEIRKQKAQPIQTQSPDQTSLGQQRPIQDSFQEGIQAPMPIHDPFQEGLQTPMPIHDPFSGVTQEQFQDGIEEPKDIHDDFQEITQKPRFAREFFPDDSEREPEETSYVQNVPSGTTQNVEKPKSKIQDMENFFPEKVQNIHDFERELEEETKRAVQSMKKASADKPSDIEVVNKEVNKEVEIVRKPIITMIKRKKVSYLPKQKGNSVPSENKKEEKKENENGESSGSTENIENSNNKNNNIYKNDKDGNHDDSDTNKAE
jgi:hypothetical protein